MLKSQRAPEAEKAVIGSLLIDNAHWPAARELLTAESFTDTRLKTTWKVIGELIENGKAADVVTVISKLRDRGEYDGVGAEYLSSCVSGVGMTLHAPHYAKIVATAEIGRKLLDACRALAVDPTDSGLETCRTLVLKHEAMGAPDLFVYGRDLSRMVESLMDEKQQRLYQTGFPALDQAWQGANPGEINTWGAATNVGKSVMLLNLMHRAALQGQKCLYVGTEMSAKETVQRHAAVGSGIPAWRIRKGALRGDDGARLMNGLGNLSELPVAVLDLPEPSLSDVESAIGAHKAEVVFLDYLERFSLPREESMRLRVKEFMRRLKTMARRRQVVVHLASQLNRDSYGRQEARPTLADLSESSAVEKESDRVMLMWAPKGKQLLERSRIIEVFQAKNRHGRARLVFDLRMDIDTLEIFETEVQSEA